MLISLPVRNLCAMVRVGLTRDVVAYSTYDLGEAVNIHAWELCPQILLFSLS